MTTALAFAAGALGAWGLASLVPTPVGALLRRLAKRFSSRGRGHRPGSSTRVVSLLARAGRRLSPALRLGAPRELERRLAAAGLAGPAGGPLAALDASDLMAAKLAGALAGLCGGLSAGSFAPGRLGLLLVLGSPVAGFLAPDLWLARLARERARLVRRELPGMLDLLRVSVDAGLTLRSALAAIGERTGGVLAAEWRVVAREVALGVPLASALAALSERVPLPEVRALIAALGRTIRHGAPLATTLEAQARDARAARRRRIREEAARAGPKIQLVVALLLVPSVLLLVAAALASALLDGGTDALGV